MARRPVEASVGINQSSAGTTELIEGIPDTIIRVLNYTVIMDGGGTYKFTAGTFESGAMPAEDKGGASPAGSRDSAIIVCPRGAGLSIVTTTGAAKGHLTYERTPRGG